MSNYYNSDYFASEIFNFDYAAIADTIISIYQPRSIIEFGCGTGALSKEFALRGIKVVALDGYSKPDFSDMPNIQFSTVDFNNPIATATVLEQFEETFDIAISIEVAEHLNPDVSEFFIQWMTSAADVVVFSAAVPGQGGDGHINCRSRQDWYNFIKANDFVIVDTLRNNFRSNPNLGLWHKLNIIDYVKKNTEFSKNIELNELIERLNESESFAASLCFQYVRKTEIRDWALSLQPIKYALKFRNILTRLLGKVSIEI